MRGLADESIHCGETERPTAPKRRYPCDEKLVRRAMDGDQEAFTALFQATCRPIRCAIREILHREEDVNDALQNTYIKAFKYLPTLRHPEAFYNWLRCTAENCARDVRSAVDADSRRLVPLEEGALSESAVYDEMDGSNLRTDMTDVLTHLNPRYAEVLILYYFCRDASCGNRPHSARTAQHRPQPIHRRQTQRFADTGGKGNRPPLYGGSPTGILAAALNDAVEADMLAALNIQTAIGHLADAKLPECERRAVRQL